MGKCVSHNIMSCLLIDGVYVQLRSISIHYLHMQTGFQAPLRHLIQLLIMLLHPIIYLLKVLYNMSIVRNHAMYSMHHSKDNVYMYISYT